MSDHSSETLTPVLYLPHGGGPLPILGDPRHKNMVDFLRGAAKELGQPSAILVVSAHWEEDQPTVMSASHPEMLYDYYGFPPESYKIKYPAPGEPRLAEQIRDLIEAAGGKAKLDSRRGFDHGLFIPLMLMYPEARIPCVQLSLLKNLDPAAHIALGKAIASLRRQNVLIVGSGMSFHNMKAFFAVDDESTAAANQFDGWLRETCADTALANGDRERRLLEWDKAPAARFCHPREEHLLPLHVCYGAASAETPVARVVFNREVMGKTVTGLVW
jgi:aromatic ring-opening dioxygenase catalytic subunit (LigB family)